MEFQRKWEHHFTENSLIILVLAIPVKVGFLPDDPFLVFFRRPRIQPDTVLRPILRVDIEIDTFDILYTPDLLLFRNQFLSPSLSVTPYHL